MKIGLAPELGATEKRQLKDWLIRALAEPNLSPGTFPLGDKIAVYIDGQACAVQNSYWSRQGSVLYIGNHRGTEYTISLVERVAILGALISAAQLWDVLTDQYSTAVSRVLLESYNTAMSGLVRTQQGIATGLAFSSDRSQVAAKMGDGYYLPNGTQVPMDQINSPAWTVVE